MPSVICFFSVRNVRKSSLGRPTVNPGRLVRIRVYVLLIYADGTLLKIYVLNSALPCYPGDHGNIFGNLYVTLCTVLQYKKVHLIEP